MSTATRSAALARVARRPVPVGRATTSLVAQGPVAEQHRRPRPVVTASAAAEAAAADGRTPPSVRAAPDETSRAVRRPAPMEQTPRSPQWAVAAELAVLQQQGPAELAVGRAAVAAAEDHNPAHNEAELAAMAAS